MVYKREGIEIDGWRGRCGRWMEEEGERREEREKKLVLKVDKKKEKRWESG